MSYRVVYGETIPAWERIFATKKDADRFAAKQSSFGDIVFSVRKVVPGERARSLSAAIRSQPIRGEFPANRKGKSKWQKST